MSTSFEQAARSSLFFLGHSPGNEYAPIRYPAAPEERPHLAYYGTTRSGKTYAMEYVLQQLARERSAGFCYVDPHGSSYWRMASFLRQFGVTDRVLFWDINDPDYIVTYDPFAVPTQAASYVASNLASALLATLGRQADAHEQPHLKTMTEDGLEALLKLGLPFPLAYQLFDPSETRLKQAMAARLARSNLVTSVAAMSRYQDRRDELAAPFRRFVNLFRDDRLRLSFAAPGVDFRRLMDEGWIVLVNTEQRDQSDEAAVLFTRLLIKQFFLAAKTRDQQRPAPFFLAIDEASRYLTTDTAQILDQTAKFGLYLILGMQGQEQARLENEETYLAIRRNMNGEVVMRVTDYDEKLYFARRFFSDGFDYRTIKWQAPPRLAAIPRTVAHVTRTTTTANTETDTWHDSHSASSSETRTIPDDDRSLDGTISAGSASGRVSSEGGSRSTMESLGLSEGFHVEYDYREEVTTPVYFTPDELEREATKLFSVRPSGMAQRLGVARVNELAPGPIEVPQLERALYARDEMVPWLRDFKRTQPATLAREEAEERFAQAIDLTALDPEDSIQHRKIIRPSTEEWDFGVPLDPRSGTPAAAQSAGDEAAGAKSRKAARTPLTPTNVKEERAKKRRTQSAQDRRDDAG